MQDTFYKFLFHTHTYSLHAQMLSSVPEHTSTAISRATFSSSSIWSYLMQGTHSISHVQNKALTPFHCCANGGLALLTQEVVHQVQLSDQVWRRRIPVSQGMVGLSKAKALVHAWCFMGQSRTLVNEPLTARPYGPAQRARITVI